MKTDGVEAIEIETNIGGEKKTVRASHETFKRVSKMFAEDALKSEQQGGQMKYVVDPVVNPESDGTSTFGPKVDTASTTDELHQIITCPYCEGQDIECLSTEKVTSQLTLFEGGAAQTKTKVKSQDSFICCGCSALAKLSWREAKEDKK